MPDIDSINQIIDYLQRKSKLLFNKSNEENNRTNQYFGVDQSIFKIFKFIYLASKSLDYYIGVGMEV